MRAGLSVREQKRRNEAEGAFFALNLIMASLIRCFFIDCKKRPRLKTRWMRFRLLK